MFRRITRSLMVLVIVVTSSPVLLAQYDSSFDLDDEYRLDLGMDDRLDRLDRGVDPFGPGDAPPYRPLTDQLGLRLRTLRPFAGTDDDRSLDRPLDRIPGIESRARIGLSSETTFERMERERERERLIAPDRLRMETYGTASDLYR